MRFFRQTMLSQGREFPVTRVLCDRGFYDVAFIDCLEGTRFSSIIAVPISHTMQREILQVKQWNPISKGVEVGEFNFEHHDRTWTHPRRYVVVRQSIYIRPKASGKQPRLSKDLEDGSTYRISVMITDNGEATPEEIWKHYRPRANDENVVKDLKEGY